MFIKKFLKNNPFVFSQLNKQPVYYLSDKSKQELEVFQEFKQAQYYQTQQKYTLAIEYYTRVLEILKTVNQQCNSSYSELLLEIAKISVLCKDEALQIQCYSKFLNIVVNQQLFFDENFDFAKRQIHLEFQKDIDQAICWVKQIHMNRQLFDLDNDKYKKQQLEFLSATINLFPKNKIEIAIQQLREIQKCVKNKDLIWRIYSNKAVGKWLLNYPQFNVLKLEKNAYTSQSNMDKELFLNIMAQFKKALKAMNEDHVKQSGNKEIQENFNELLEENSEQDEELFKKNIFSHENVYSSNTKKLLMIIVDFCIDAGNEFVKEQNFWLHQALKYYEANFPEQIHIPLSSYAFQAFIQQEIMKSEGLYGTVNSGMENEKLSIQGINKFQYGQMISVIDKRENEGEKLMNEGFEILEQVPKHQVYLKYITLLE